MYQLKRIVAVFIACLLLSSGLFAFAEDNGDRHSDVMDVVFPSDISFDIVVVPAPYEGFVTSREFKIINNGDEDVAVRLFAAQLTFSDEVNFSISDTGELPETGNSIFAELICISGETQETLPLRNEPGDEEYIYYLESGDEGIFKIEGVVNEAGDVPWSDNKVTVSICYSMGNDEESLEEALEQAKAEIEEAGDNEAEENSEPEASESEASTEDAGDTIIEDIIETIPAEASPVLEVVLEASKVGEHEGNPEAAEEQEHSDTESTPELKQEHEASETTTAPEDVPAT